MRSMRANKSGVSFMEFVGCLAALSGGVVLGSMYLGVDMQSMAIEVLEKSQIVDTGLLKFSAEDEEANTDTEALLAKQSLATEEANHAESSPVQPTAAEEKPVLSKQTRSEEPSPSVVDLTEGERQKATQAYWHALTACMQEESMRRHTIVQDAANWLLFDYLMHRKVGHQNAVESLEQLNNHGIDPRLISHAAQVKTWHLAGAQLYGRSVDLLTDGPSAELSGPFAQSWQSAATQHRMEEKLVREKHLGVAGYLDHTYKELAPFQPAAMR